MGRVFNFTRLVCQQILAFVGLGLFVIAAVQLWRGGSGSSLPAEIEPGVAAGDPQDEQEVQDDRPLVVLDPGHGGRDGGTVAGGALEKALNLDTAKRVARLLRANGVRVTFTRDSDVFVELNERARFANRHPSALMVSIHHNAVSSAVPKGIETYFSHPKPSSVLRPQRVLLGVRGGESFIDRRGEELARRVQQATCRVTGAPDRGIKNRRFAVTHWVTGPAVLIEVGFLSNPAERGKLLSDGYRDKLCRGIADGVLDFLRAVEGDAVLGVSFPDRTPRSELADIKAAGAER